MQIVAAVFLMLQKVSSMFSGKFVHGRARWLLSWAAFISQPSFSLFVSSMILTERQS
jgi:hypothetical protein